jgi:DNA-directed RNA polymerase subunit K/omega
MKIIEDYNETIIKTDPSKHTTRNVMTKYELTKVIGMRVEQLARGSPTLIDVEAEIGETNNVHTLHKIAQLELEKKVLPFILQRSLPNGEKEYWRIQDMVIPSYAMAI